MVGVSNSFKRRETRRVERLVEFINFSLHVMCYSYYYQYYSIFLLCKSNKYKIGSINILFFSRYFFFKISAKEVKAENDLGEPIFSLTVGPKTSPILACRYLSYDPSLVKKYPIIIS